RGIRIQADCFVVVRDGMAEIAFGIPGVAAVLVGGRKVGRERDRLIEIGDGVRKVAAVEIGKAAQSVGDAGGLAVQAAGLDQSGAGGDAVVGEVDGLGYAAAHVAALRQC